MPRPVLGWSFFAKDRSGTGAVRHHEITERLLIATAKKAREPETGTWQAAFLQVLPGIKRWARASFRDMDVGAREDAVSEVVANAMCADRRLHQRGEWQRAFPSALARVCDCPIPGRPPRRKFPGLPGCVFAAGQEAGYETLPIGTPDEQAAEWMEYLVDNRRTPILNQVAFRIDF